MLGRMQRIIFVLLVDHLILETSCQSNGEDKACSESSCRSTDSESSTMRSKTKIVGRDHLLIQRKLVKSEKVSNKKTMQCEQQAYDSSPGRYGHYRGGMHQCQGDCDSDWDCARGLKCFQRSWLEAVPGCAGHSIPNFDYCYDPQCENATQPNITLPPTDALDSSPGRHGSGNMSKCQGDCDNDNDCAGNLTCFQRYAWESVPGCSGHGKFGFDYCYDPQENTSQPSSSTTTSQPSSSTPQPKTPVQDACLCVFDIDRTLTGKQGSAHECPGNKEIKGIPDHAYGGGTLTLSALGVAGLESTFCDACYLGIVSAGDASGDGSKERDYLIANVLLSKAHKALQEKTPNASVWSYPDNIDSPFVLTMADRRKQDAVEKIQDWYNQQGISLANDRIHFFGDRTENIGPFAEKGYNAREISCASRDSSIGDGIVGLCGAVPEEIVDSRGVAVCKDQTSTPPPSENACLCIFDVDRTLTAAQHGGYGLCPDVKRIPGIHDTAYGGGTLVLSELAARGLGETFCDACFLGIVSAGNVGGHGSAERDYLMQHVLVTTAHSKLKDRLPGINTWSYPSSVRSPFVLAQPDRQKQYAVEKIQQWYESQGITVAPKHIHFFGDRTENIGPFAEKGFNAREISCASRDWSRHKIVGYCGARVSEIVDTPGIVTCDGSNHFAFKS
eukprot:TRINITY_DN49691_c0_g1_i1.p1 TRINITY_DN49691_c0_g1~~TRINITY_DN49691_c0_g1_i1.p1  ORF type:complete len:672 (-),score=95.13 TRINITY_DN49691_c0_g1_i1:445-2460(-)